MTKVTIITQNFSSPNDPSGTPLMLLPQPPSPPMTTTADKDQDGFSQLLLHDRHRQRQSYVQSYTAFETLKKRQDFVLRQENLRSLQSFIERMATKQDQFIDQSFMSYKQCFGKFINVKPSTHRRLQEQQNRPKTAAPALDSGSSRQLLHVPATPLEPPPLAPFHRYQKSHRPSSSNRYRSNVNSLRTAKPRQDPFRTTSLMSHSQPFISFSESYFQKHNEGPNTKSQVFRYNSGAERSTGKFQTPTTFNSDSPSSRTPRTRATTDRRSANKFRTPTHNGHGKVTITKTERHSPISNVSPIPAHDDEQFSSEHLLEESHVEDFPLRESSLANILDEDDDHRDQEPAQEPSATVDHTVHRSSTTPPATATNTIDVKVTKISRPDSTEHKLLSRTTPVQAVDDVKRAPTPSVRSTVVSRLTNTPASTPEIGYHDAVRDGLVQEKAAEEDGHLKKPVINTERRLSQHSNTLTNDSRSKSTTKRPKTAKRKHTIVVAVPLASTPLLTSPTGLDDQDILEAAITVQNYTTNTPESVAPSKTKRRRTPTTSSSQPKKTPSVVSQSSTTAKSDIAKPKDEVHSQLSTTTANEQAPPAPTTVKVDVTPPAAVNILPTVNQQHELLDDKLPRPKKDAFDTAGPSILMTNAELKTLGSHRSVAKKTRFNVGKEDKQKSSEKAIVHDPETLELIEKIRNSEIGNDIGRVSISKQGCRFELPPDLKKLEDLTPLEYIGSYCRLSPHRRYQFKRIFDRYRNSKYGFDIANLYTALTDIHTSSFTRAQYDKLCRLIDVEGQQHQFSFETFAGILAVCERLVYDALNSSSDPEDYELAKDPLEKCDFDSLDRKLDGFTISKPMIKLLKTL